MDYGMDDFDLLDDQPTPFARWAIPGLFLSLLIHIAGLLWLSQLPSLSPLFDTAPPPPPVMMKVTSVAIDPKIYEPQAAKTKKAAAMPQAVELPKDKPAFDQMMAQQKGAPAAPKIDNPLLAEKPSVEATTYQQTVETAEQGGVKSVASDLDQVRQDLLMDKPGVTGQPLLEIANPGTESGGSPSTVGPLAGASTPGFSNLDALLAETGPLSAETAPIRMDSDVLYSYDSFDLQPNAVLSLQKLGQIIQKNPQLDFTIEGHSDSSGDATYNLQLSQQRALAVKAWLVQAMHIDPSRLTTRGFGTSRLIVPATLPFDEQKESLNRRVEIVLHDRAAAPR
jgi:OmpA-OmpF porin, OOP family